MKRIALLLALAISPAFGQGSSSPLTSATSVVPSSTGSPNSVAILWPYEFVSVQNAGQIFTYNISSGSQVLVGSYTTPSCSVPSGIVITNLAGVNVMAYVCYDGNALYTARVGSGGLLTALGSVTGLPYPYPGIALDGTNVYVPLHGVTSSANGGVAKVSIATPSAPTVTATTTLASATPGVYQNPGYLAVAGGFIYVEAGSEPGTSASTIQVLNESTMALVGTPLSVVHSPQYISVQGNVAYVTFYDTPQLESINISSPASLSSLQTLSMPTCHSVPVILRDRYAFVGCYEEGTIQVVDVSNPSDMQIVQTFTGLVQPQRLKFDDQYLFATGDIAGGSVYQILTDGTYYQQIDASNIYANSLQAGMLNANSASVTNNLTVQGAAYLGAGSTVAGSPICTPANAGCGISALTGDVSATGPGSAVAAVTGVHATSGTLDGVTIGGMTPASATFSALSVNGVTKLKNGSSATGLYIGSGTEVNVGSDAYLEATGAAGYSGGVTVSRGDTTRFSSVDLITGANLNTGWSMQMGVSSTDWLLLDRVNNANSIDCQAGAANPCTFNKPIVTTIYYGPTTAPSGSCTTNGAWVFSRDGHATFCSSGTWVTKI